MAFSPDVKRTVVVTGASSGIGLATVLRVAGQGFRAVGLIPDEEGRQSLVHEAALRSLDVEMLIVDLADPKARARVISAIEPWGLVNNAGYMNAGRIQDIPLDEIRQQLEVMLLAPIDLAQQALPSMLRAGQGRIVNVTTSAVHTSTPLTGCYAACKAAFREINDSLRLELRGTGVEVIDVEPGGYRTGIWDRAARELRERRVGSTRPDLYDRALRRLDGGAKRMGDPEDVANAISKLLTASEPRSHRRIGPGSGLLRTLDAAIPDRLWDWAVGKLAGESKR